MLAISIVLLLLIRVDSAVMRVVVRILLLPVIAGISYEVPVSYTHLDVYKRQITFRLMRLFMISLMR